MAGGALAYSCGAAVGQAPPLWALQREAAALAGSRTSRTQALAVALLPFFFAGGAISSSGGGSLSGLGGMFALRLERDLRRGDGAEAEAEAGAAAGG